MPTLTLGELAELTGAKLHGEADLRVDSVAPLDAAGPGQLAYLADAKLAGALAETGATVVILTPERLGDCPVAALVHDNPKLAYARAAAALHAEPAPVPGVHATAVVDATARVAAGAVVGPFAVVGPRCVVEEGAVIGPHCVLEADCEVGRGTRLVAHVTLCRATRLGRDCLVHPGAVLGADGFGLARDGDRWVKIPQLGRVIVGDAVEIGAGCTIDRGALGDTVLGDGVKLDNLVHVAHNVEIGADTAMAAQVGIAGSSRIGARCTIAGKVGINGHVELTDEVHVSGLTAVTGPLREPGQYTGTVPALPHREWRRNFARLRQLDELHRRVRALERALAERDASADAS